jgi:hypothetical protein
VLIRVARLAEERRSHISGSVTWGQQYNNIFNPRVTYCEVTKSLPRLCKEIKFGKASRPIGRIVRRTKDEHSDEIQNCNPLYPCYAE